MRGGENVLSLVLVFSCFTVPFLLLSHLTRHLLFFPLHVNALISPSTHALTSGNALVASAESMGLHRRFGIIFNS